jgi:large subunit ribosomal protein L29
VKAKDLRELNDDELSQQLQERQEALTVFRVQMATGSVDNVRGARNARRDIARIKTILGERSRATMKGAPKP